MTFTWKRKIIVEFPLGREKAYDREKKGSYLGPIRSVPKLDEFFFCLEEKRGPVFWGSFPTMTRLQEELTTPTVVKASSPAGINVILG
jgi:hypothetical protein